MDFILRYDEGHGVIPASKVLAHEFGVSVRTIEAHISHLADKGSLVFGPNRGRRSINPVLRICPHCGLSPADTPPAKSWAHELLT